MKMYCVLLFLLLQVLCTKATYDIPHFVESYGYPIEVHNVTSPDGYILTLHRIPHSKNSTCSSKVVFMPTCLLCNSMAYLLLGPRKAFAFLLSDNGYDVWMLNSRGTSYSQRHTNLSNKSFKYWDFTFHEMGIYDLPTSVDYVMNITNVDKIDIAAFSMGATQTFIFLSKLPEYNKKIRAMAITSPAIYLKYSYSPVTQLAPFHAIILEISRQMRFYYFPMKELNIRRNMGNICGNTGNIVYEIFCNLLFSMFLGNANVGIEQKVKDQIPNSLPDITSMKSLSHFAQSMGRGGFREFDYGRYGNMKRYNRFFPPRYNLKNINVPIHLVSSIGDAVVTSRDVSELAKDLNDVKGHLILNKSFYGHGHFVWGENSKEDIFDKQLEFLNSNNI